MIFYLPHGPEAYEGAFSDTSGQKRVFVSHSIVETKGNVLISPDSLNLKTLHPQHFIDLKEMLAIERIWLFDDVRDSETVIQIIDHRNLTGQNPLMDRTPIGDRPRFLDVSHIYVKEEMGIPQRVVNTVGPHRFRQVSIEYKSDVAALVALCAAYAGIEIAAIGWNREKDRNGRELKRFLSGIIT